MIGSREPPRTEPLAMEDQPSNSNLHLTTAKLW
eukprot:COSAG04_NODE_189_length_20957_cov_46.399463_14_plen_33_part_00